jgi:hypothetical protein
VKLVRVDASNDRSTVSQSQKEADLAGPGIDGYKIILPRDYNPLWSPKQTQPAIFQVKRYIEDNLWNHLTIQVQRTSDNKLLYQSITLNRQQYNLNAYYYPTSTSWYWITINYQMDGNSPQQPYQVWLDNLSFRYW